jgi:hypothetical protein
MPQDIENLVNREFGFLKVLSFDRRTKYGNHWLCECRCGTKRTLSSNSLKTGNTKSCGRCKAFVGSANKNWKGYGEISRHFFRQIYHNAAMRKIEFQLSIEHIWDLFLKQNRKCVFTNVELIFAKSYKTNERKMQTASLDRIDSSLGYLEGNVQWVHKDINMMKRGILNEDFIRLCSLVASYVNCNKRQN